MSNNVIHRTSVLFRLAFLIWFSIHLMSGCTVNQAYVLQDEPFHSESIYVIEEIRIQPVEAEYLFRPIIRDFIRFALSEHGMRPVFLDEGKGVFDQIHIIEGDLFATNGLDVFEDGEVFVEQIDPSEPLFLDMQKKTNALSEGNKEPFIQGSEFNEVRRGLLEKYDPEDLISTSVLMVYNQKDFISGNKNALTISFVFKNYETKEVLLESRVTKQSTLDLTQFHKIQHFFSLAIDESQKSLVKYKKNKAKK